MAKHIELKTMNQGTALAMGTLALPHLVTRGRGVQGQLTAAVMAYPTASRCRPCRPSPPFSRHAKTPQSECDADVP